MALYHTEIGLPKWFTAPACTVSPRYGDHARFEAQVDRYGKIQLPKTIDLSKFKVIEVGAEGQRVTKILFRGSLDAKRDLCIVLQPDGYAKTVWVNLKSDTHRTLDRSRYNVP